MYVKYTNTEKGHNPKTHVEMECSQLASGLGISHLPGLAP